MCNCEENKNNCFESECEETKACEQHLSTSCIFYRLENQENSKLYTINVENGTPLNTILELFDAKLNNIQSANFNAFTIPYLKSKGVVTTMKNFAEMVSTELGRLNAKSIVVNSKVDEVITDVEENTQAIYSLRYPQITDSSIAGFTVYSDIKTVLQKLSDKIAVISTTIPTTPTLSALETSTVRFTLSGNPSQTISAISKVSSTANNMLQVMPDGLYVSSINIPNQYQTLGITGNILTLTNGGNVVLPPSTLTLSGTTLGIAGSTATINLAPLLTTSQQTITKNDTTSISFVLSGVLNHTLSANVNISQEAGNILVNRTTGNTGLYVPATQAQAVLDEINNSAPNSTLKNTFCSIQSSTCKIAYRFYIKNTSGVAVNDFTYIDKDTGNETINFAIGESKTLLNVARITYPTLDSFDVKFLGV